MAGGGPVLPNCIKEYFPNDTIFTHTIPVGTVLYSGSRKPFPESKANSNLQSKSGNTYRYKFFTPNFETAKVFGSLELKNKEHDGFVGEYKVIKEIPIYLNKKLNKNTFYYNTVKGYSSAPAQCLCTGGFHGYATIDKNNLLDDIGLCADLQNHLELVAIYKFKDSFQQGFEMKGGGTRRRRKSSAFWPPKYYRGLTRKQATARHKEILKFGAKDTSDPKAYVGFKTDRGIQTKPSSYTKQWSALFPEAKSIEERAKASGVPKRFLQESYDRGMAAWRTGHRPGATQQQWGYARVSSLLMCGKTHYSTDSDLVRKAKAASPSARKWFTRCKAR